MHTRATANDTFLAALAAPGRSSEIPESADAYGWLDGSWELQVLHYKAVDVSALGVKGEALNPDGQTWRLEGEFRAKRVQP